MLNIHELERNWVRYKIKSYIPLAVTGVLSLSFIIIGLIYAPGLLENKEEPAVSQVAIKEALKPQTNKVAPAAIITPDTTTIVTDKAPISKQKSEVKESVQEETPKPIKAVTKPAMVLKPSMNFLNNIELADTAVYQPEVKKKPVAPIVKVAPAPKQIVSKPKVEPLPESVVTEIVNEPVVQVKAKTEPKVSIITKEDEDDLNDVIKRFKKNKNPALSLFIAKRYYSMGVYQKSYNYALMTNDIDHNIEESWLIFAKSLVKLGQKSLAVETLESYVQKTESTRARNLLKAILQGTFE